MEALPWWRWVGRVGRWCGAGSRHGLRGDPRAQWHPEQKKQKAHAYREEMVCV